MAAYDVINGYDPIQTFTYSGYPWWYQARIPTGANVGTPLGVIFWLAQASKTMNNFTGSGALGSQACAQACINNQRTDSFGIRIDTGNHAGYIIVFLPEWDGGDVSRAVWHTAFRPCIAHLEAQGYNINRRKINAAGWSTGAIQWYYAALKDPTLWNAAWLADPSIVSAAITDYGNGPPFGLFVNDINGNPCFDPPIIATGPSHSNPWEYDGNPSNDDYMLTELARLLKLAAVKAIHATADIGSIYMPFYGRAINDLYNSGGVPDSKTPQSKSLLKELQALGSVVTNTTGGTGSAIVVANATEFSQRFLTGGSHDDANNFMYNATNWPLALTWLDAQEKPIAWVAPTPTRGRLARMLMC